MGRNFALSPQPTVIALAALLVLGGTFAALKLAIGTSSPSSAQVLRPAAPAALRFAPAPAVSTPARATPTPLPPVVARALDAHRVVVVSLVSPGSQVDVVVAQEARSGAGRAGAGWISLDALDERQTEPLLRRFGVVQDPSVLVFRRPGELVNRIEGFADRDVIAQIAMDAAR